MAELPMLDKAPLHTQSLIFIYVVQNLKGEHGSHPGDYSYPIGTVKQESKKSGLPNFYYNEAKYI